MEATLFADADTNYFSPDIVAPAGGVSGHLTIEIDANGGPDEKLAKLASKTIQAIPNFDDGKIGKWRLAGSLSDELGLSN
jgi:hypothetical protein